VAAEAKRFASTDLGSTLRFLGVKLLDESLARFVDRLVFRSAHHRLVQTPRCTIIDVLHPGGSPQFGPASGAKFKIQNSGSPGCLTVRLHLEHRGQASTKRRGRDATRPDATLLGKRGERILPAPL